MKTERLYIIYLLFILIFGAGCMKDGSEENRAEGNDPDTKVRNAVVEYMEEENWNPDFYTIDKWINASVRKATADERYKNIDESFMGKEIYIVTIADALAAPLILVDPETFEVIGIMPGE